jgi:hypothetical protein
MISAGCKSSSSLIKNWQYYFDMLEPSCDLSDSKEI